MEYSIVARENPLDRDAAAKFYPKPEWNQEITIRRLSEKYNEPIKPHNKRRRIKV